MNHSLIFKTKSITTLAIGLENFLKTERVSKISNICLLKKSRALLNTVFVWRTNFPMESLEADLS